MQHGQAGHAVRSGDDGQAAEQVEQRHGDAVDADRRAALERDLDRRGLARSHGDGPGRRRAVAEAAEFDRQRDVPLARILELALRRHVPLAGRRQHRDCRIERANRPIERRSAAGGIAVRDTGRLLDVGDLDGFLRDERVRERGSDRRQLAQDSRLERAQHVVAGEGVAGVDTWARRAPVASARSRISSSTSLPCPRSTVTAMISAPRP